MTERTPYEAARRAIALKMQLQDFGHDITDDDGEAAFQTNSEQGARFEAAVDAAAKAAIQALIDTPPSSQMMLRAGMALGELIRDHPGSRPGDMFVAQWKAALKAAVEEGQSE